MTFLDAFATERHYLDHLLPVWRALDEDERGILYAPPNLRGLAERMIPADHVVTAPPPRTGPAVLVASYWDARRVHKRPVVMMEHGVGQSYREPHDAYAGGGRREHVVLFLCPTQRVADANRARYPDTPSVVIGSPRLDRHKGPGYRQAAATRLASPPVVAVTFHWDMKGIPETRSALPHYRAALPGLVADERWTVLGHCHPRDERNARQLWEHLGVEFEPDFERVLDRASVLVADNTSVLYEMAAIGRPVVVLDAPWYRRSAGHGLRFWEHADVGVRIGDPAELSTAVELALEDRTWVQARRRIVVRALFGGLLDGRASERAARAIRETLAAEVRA